MKIRELDKSRFYRLFFPALAEAVLSQLFFMVDSIMLGHMEDSTASVAAVGLCGPCVNLVVCVTSAFFIGTTATVAWHYGAKEDDQVRNVAWQSIALSLIIAVVFSGLALVGAKPLMKFVCGEGELLPLATSYFRINAYGFFFQILVLNLTAAFRGVGISRLPMVYNIIGSAVNVVFNYALIYGKWGFPEMRIEGAAWATVLSKIVAFVIAFGILLFGKSSIRFRKGISFRPTRSFMHRLVPIGLTSAGEQLILQGGATISTKIISVLPTSEIAATQVGVNVECFTWAAGGACGTTSTALFGMSLGENNVEQAKAYLRLTIIWAEIMGAVVMASMMLFGEPLASLFTNDASLYPMAAKLMLICSFSLPFISAHTSLSGALRGAGDSLAPLLASLLSLWMFRVGLGYLTIRVFDGNAYAYRWCLFADQFIRFCAMAFFYLTGHWRKRMRRGMD